jgi:dTDP-4-dehydrorhamnose 3,5-epimerase
VKLDETPIRGLVVVRPTPSRDARGSFTRAFSARAFREAGLDGHFVESSVASNPARGTLRGMHYVKTGCLEAKLVRCVQGKAFDVLVDLRRGEPTFKRWLAFELSADNQLSLYVPPGVAHGYLTLEDDTDLYYLMTTEYDPDAALGARYDDLAFGIAWPSAPVLVSDRDRSYEDFR